MASKIPQFIELYNYPGDKELLWEMVKMEIWSFTINFAKLKEWVDFIETASYIAFMHG